MNYPSDFVKVRESTFYSDCVNKDIKILSVGDIHLSKNVDLFSVDKLLKLIDSINPDYIMILGDTVDTPMELSYDKRLLELDVLIKNCSNIGKTFIILGNHDYYYDKPNDLMTISTIWDKYKDANTHILIDQSYTDDNIFVGGYLQKGSAYFKDGSNMEDDLAFYNDLSSKESLVKDLPSDKYKIFLNHSPEPIQSSMNQELLKDYNLVITGHYHNGVVPNILEGILPKNKGLLTPRRNVFPAEARGIVKLPTGTYLIYNGGWTKIPATAKDFMCSFDKYFNRDIDVTTVTNNYEYFDSFVKTKKLKL